MNIFISFTEMPSSFHCLNLECCGKVSFSVVRKVSACLSVSFTKLCKTFSVRNNKKNTIHQPHWECL